MKADDFVQRKGVLASLEHGATDEVSARASDDVICFLRKIDPDKTCEDGRTPNRGAKSSGAEEVIAHPLTFRYAWFGGEVAFGIEEVDCAEYRSILQVECAARQDFIQIPSTAGRDSRRRVPNHLFDRGPGRGVENLLQDEKVYVFVAQSESKVISHASSGPITPVEDQPLAILPVTVANVLVRDAARATNWRLYVEFAGKR